MRGQRARVPCGKPSAAAKFVDDENATTHVTARRS